MEPQDPPPGSKDDVNEDFTGSLTSIEEIIGALAIHGCLNLTSSIDFDACSNFPCAGGGFSNVYQGSMQDGTRIAIKSLRVYDRPITEGDHNWPKIIERITRELRQWSRLQHCNVLPLMGLVVFRGHISMVSQWVENGDLMSYLRKNPEVDRIKLCIDICAGLCYIHAKDLIHGDLKATNVLVSPDGTALIADFGNAELESFSPKPMNPRKGCLSVRWAAPELLLADDGPHASKEADVYAYGMTALEVFTGKIPHPEVSDIQVIGLVAYERKLPPRPDTRMDDRLWKILNWCWAREPSRRPRMTSVDYCLHALFRPTPNSLGERNHASLDGALKGIQSKQNTTALWPKEPGRLWVHSVPREVADSASDQEKKRQEAINEVIRTEFEFVHNLKNLRDRWMEPLRTEDIIPFDRRPDFIKQVFWNIKDILEVNARLLDLLAQRQNAHPIVETIGDIFLELVPHFHLFVQYSKHNLYGRYELEQEKSANLAFEVFLETVERSPENNLEMNECLLLPMAQLARYPQLLEAVLKYTPDDSVDRVAIPQAVRIVSNFLDEVNGTESKLKLLRLGEGPAFRKEEEANIALDKQHQLVYQGPLKWRGGPAHESTDLRVFLFDDVLVMIKREVTNGRARRVIFRRPIPLQLLAVSVPKKQASGELIPRTQPQRSSGGSLANGATPNGSILNGSSTNESALDAPLLTITPAQPNLQKAGYRLTMSHLGRKGYSLTLRAPTSAVRRQWLEHITAQQTAISEQNVIFHTSARGEDIFVGEAKVNCAAPHDNGQRIAYGTNAGIYFQSLSEGQNRTPVKVVDLIDVQQLDVLEECQLLVALSGRSVLAFPLNAFDTADRLKRMKRISSCTSFFKAGFCLGRKLLCMVKSSPLLSTIKVLELIDQELLEKNKPTSDKQPQGGDITFKMLTEFSIPTESRSVHFLESKLCMACAGGFKVVDLETLDTHSLLDPADPSLNFVQHHNDVYPLSIYEIDEEYLLCYTNVAFFTSKNGYRSRKDVDIYWEGAPTAFALHYPFIMAFDQKYIEVRHVDDGTLVQVIRGNNLRLLFANAQPSILNSLISSSIANSITGDSKASRSYRDYSLPHGNHHHGQSKSGQHDTPVSDPAHAQRTQRLVYKRDEIIVASDGKVMTVQRVGQDARPKA